MEVQAANFKRVEGKIAPIVLSFLKEIGPDAEFHMQDLLTYVSKRSFISPDSPSRILRDLKKKGKIDYKVISRRDSHYKFIGFVAAAKFSHELTETEEDTLVHLVLGLGPVEAQCAYVLGFIERHGLAKKLIKDLVKNQGLNGDLDE